MSSTACAGTPHAWSAASTSAGARARVHSASAASPSSALAAPREQILAPDRSAQRAPVFFAAHRDRHPRVLARAREDPVRVQRAILVAGRRRERPCAV